MTALDLPVATGGDSDQDRWTKNTGALLEAWPLGHVQARFVAHTVLI